MLRSKLCILVTALLLTSIIGCTDNKLEDNLENKATLEDTSRARNDKIRESYAEQVSIAKEYEMNIVLALAKKYEWNALKAGETVTEESYTAKGVYSLEKLEEALGVTKSEVEALGESTSDYMEGAAGATVREVILTKEQDFVTSVIDISYYYMYETGNLEQVVTVTSRYLPKEARVIWEKGEVVDFERVN